MLHPLFRLIATQPELLAQHAQGYTELVSQEFERVSSVWKRQATLRLAALCSLCVAVALAGVAFMLWAVIPAIQMQAPWALLVAPLLPLALAGWCLLALRPTGPPRSFDNVRQQWEADLAVLREVGAP
ncbi:hypothetical protein [Rhodoferax sp.]|uniref:hypothetical protein n=1 Tax=Rhodoferax sp. TaxID=50421 RepID=UPI002762952F|nr:hypothetical protein [Rhodoferax sp.]